MRVARRLPSANHLFFADNCIIFTKAELSCLEELTRILDLYESFAGQKINFSQSELCGSKNVDEVMLRLCGDYLNMKVVECHSKYLGLPMVVGQKKKVFREIEEKV